MGQVAREAALVCFGVYEIDLRSGELRKAGVRIKVQELPLKVLAALLEHPGEVVSREDLRKRIWPEESSGDFEHAVSVAVGKLRVALGDSSDSPHVIETIPRRGYRFIASVKPSGEMVGTGRVAVGSGKVVALPTRSWKVVVTVLALVAGTAAGLLWHSRHLHHLTEKDTIVLGDFTNSTGDAVFDGTLRQGLSVQLEQSPFLSLVSEEGIHQTLRMMGQPANARLSPEITQEICQRTNGAAALDGSIAQIGTRYDLILKAVSCVNGDVLASAESQANDKSHVLDALSTTASEIRRKVGESLSTIQKYNTPLEQATTPSLEALQAYSLGMKAAGASDNVSAVSLFQRATRLDPKFAMAYWAAGINYGDIGESALAAESIGKAFELRVGVSEVEKLNIEGDYYEYVAGNLTKAQRLYVLGTQTYPREAVFHMDLGTLLNILGQYEAGLRENVKSSRLASHINLYCRFIALTYLLLNRVDEAANAAQAQQARCVDSNPADVLYEIAFYRYDPAEMSQQVASTAGKPGQEDLLLELEADTTAYFGHLGEASEFARRAADSAEHAGEKETATAYNAVATLREALFGNAAKAQHVVAAANRHSRGRDTGYAEALGLAYAGDTTRAKALADDLAKRFPEDTIMRFNYLPTIRAKLALASSNPQEALDLLKTAAPYELGLPAFSYYNWPNLYPVYVRGEAYLAAHRGSEAAAEFQKILDHRGIVLNEPIGALAHLQLGRAYAVKGDTAKAKSAYQDFLTLWRDADPEIPILKEAKAEYAKLQ